ncbi:MAG TPA: hypothetical protein VF510_13495 [Ktedonobacterales bacterium]|jgi:hypothetical protein
MFTFRNILAVAVFLFGTTFLWMTPLFIGPTAKGALWTMAQVLGFLAIIGFTVAAWGIFKAADWWETVAVVSGAVGIAATIPYAIAAPATAGVGDTLTLVINIGLHLLGSAAVIVALLVPPTEHWIGGQL